METYVALDHARSVMKQAIVGAVRDSLERLEAERGVETHLDRGIDLRLTPMSDRVREAACGAAGAVGIGTLDLHRGPPTTRCTSPT